MDSVLEKFRERRPIIHYSVPTNWMNDPNGLFFDGERYHMYYQHNPFGITHGPMYWGHATSRDLHTWENHPIALSPDKNGVIFSGSAIIDENNVSGLGNGNPPLLAFFTHHKNDENGQQTQSQSIAYSNDGGYTFEKYGKNPVITFNEADFRDPKVFYHAESNAFIMVLAVLRRIMIYRSKNLLDWELASDFKGGLTKHPGILECPDLFPLDADGKIKWVLTVSLSESVSNNMNAMGYLVGDFDGYEFTPDDSIDYIEMDGPEVYAGVTFSGIPDNRRILVAWMCQPRYIDKTPADIFRGTMTLPREIELAATSGGYRLTQKPTRELSGVLTDIIKINAGNTKRGTKIKLPKTPFAIDIDGVTESFGIVIRNGSDKLIISYDANEAAITCDRSGCGITGFLPESVKIIKRQIEIDRDSPANPNIFIAVDVTSVEIFANGGRTVITAQFFTDAPFTYADII